ncbi:hypothetical protein FACS1894120_4150 [Clostridia bacterium]|nr:hypothetical protein FACS1894120_4150 [Clostridia bacterium]
MDLPNVANLLVKNDVFFNHVHIINQKFDILPDELHYGMSIEYIDLKESREQFVRELVNTVTDWVYSNAKQDAILGQLISDGRTNANAFSELKQKAHDKFRHSNDGSLLHGQFGELLLSNCIQHILGAVPLLRKMPITTSSKLERFGADAIHYKDINGIPVFYIGEAKSYTSNYQFAKAFDASIHSIIKEYNNITGEIRQYLHEDFLSPEMEQLATDLINGELKNAEYHLVSIVAYEETGKKDGLSRTEILNSVNAIIESRFKAFDNSKIDIAGNPILNRITYIAFPIWDFESLITDFSGYISRKEGKSKNGKHD